MKPKKEIIYVAARVSIQYDPEKKGARQHARRRAKELVREAGAIGGTGDTFGGYWVDVKSAKIITP